MTSLEGATAELGRPLVVSEAIAQLTTRPTEELGCFRLKGLPHNVRAFAPGAYDMRGDAGGPQGAAQIPPTSGGLSVGTRSARRDVVRAEISSPGYPSDTHLLVESCIARVRAAACLDDDAILPPLPVVAPRRDVVVFTESQTVLAAAAPVAAAVVVAPSPPPPRVTRRGNWPLLFCAFVAGVAGGAALLASPAGQRPGVQRVTHSARAHASHAAQATMTLVSSLR